MNKVKCEPLEHMKAYLPGDIFIHEDGELYILVRSHSNKYIAASLENGCRWRDSTANIKRAVAGLTYLGTNLKIMVSR